LTGKEYLEHIGVLGMHWGRRKGGKKKPTKVIRTTSSEDHLTREKLSIKPIKEMSNKEIRTLTERIQLEKQHAILNKKEVSRGKKFVDDFLLSPLKEVASRKAKELIANQIETAIEKILTKR
jgi:hypothetical protein